MSKTSAYNLNGRSLSEVKKSRAELQQEALAKIADITSQIESLYNEAKAVADAAGVEFSLNSIDLYTEEEAQDNWASSYC